MYTFHYNLSECISEYSTLINRYNIFPYFVITVIILGLLMFFNRNNRKNDLIFTIINLIFIVLLLYAYGKPTVTNIDVVFKGNILKNMYFYFTATFFSIIIMDRLLMTSRTNQTFKTIMILFYMLVVINLLFALYIAHNIGFSSILIIGNIYPMVLLGNIVNISLYIFVIIYSIVEKLYNYYDKKKHLMY